MRRAGIIAHYNRSCLAARLSLSLGSSRAWLAAASPPPSGCVVCSSVCVCVGGWWYLWLPKYIVLACFS